MTHTFVLLNMKRDKHTFVQWRGEPVLIEFKQVGDYWKHETDNDDFALELRKSPAYGTEWIDWDLYISPSVKEEKKDKSVPPKTKVKGKTQNKKKGKK